MPLGTLNARILENALDRMPLTIDMDDEMLGWIRSNIIGVDYRQLAEGVQSPTFGISDENYYHYAAQSIQKQQQERASIQAQPLSMSEQVAITDAYRELGGIQPIHYDVTTGGAVPRNIYEEAVQKRVLEQGIIKEQLQGLGRALSNAGIGQLGILAPEFAGKLQENTERAYRGRGGTATFIADIVGQSALMGLMVATMGPAAFKTAIPAIFAGQTFGQTRIDVANERKLKNKDIGLATELGAATLNAAAEFIFERFGGKMTLGLAGQAAKFAPAIGRQIMKKSVKGVSGVLKTALREGGLNVSKYAIGGGFEEFATTMAQNTITNLYRPTDVMENTGQSFIAGALQAVLVGGPMALHSKFITPVMGSRLTPADKLGKIEAARKLISEDKDINDIVKRQMYADLDTAVDELGIEFPTTIKQDPTEGYVPPPIEDIVARINEKAPERAKAPQELSQYKRPLSRWTARLKQGLARADYNNVRVERMVSALGGYEDGDVYKSVFVPVKKAATQYRVETNRQMEEFRNFFTDTGIDIDNFMTKKVDIGPDGPSLTPDERVAVSMLADSEGGLRHLKKGNGFTDKQIAAINKSLTTEEKLLRKKFKDYYEDIETFNQLSSINKDIRNEELILEGNYYPITVEKKDVALDREVDFLSILEDAVAKKEAPKPQMGPLKSRKELAGQPVRLGSIGTFINHTARIERIKAMAPVGKQVGTILNNREFREAADSATRGQGSKILDKWLGDSVRGYSDAPSTLTGNVIDFLRTRGSTAALGLNIVTSLKQPISLLTAMAHHPEMHGHVIKNLIHSISPGLRDGLKTFVDSKSDVVKTRSMERELREVSESKSAKQKLKGKKRLSEKVMFMLKFMDGETVRVVWKSFYDFHQSKNPNVTEQQSIDFADKMTQRTQPAANIEDLPQLFRGGATEKLLTTFQNQINQQYNYYRHDILGEYKAGKISRSMVAYRTLYSAVLPSLLLGIVGRAGFGTAKEMLTDLLTYPLAGFYLVGGALKSIIDGYGPGTIASTMPEELARMSQNLQAEDPDWARVLEHGVTAAGATLGIPTAQPKRTIKGLIDLESGETEDIRRLIWSEAALKQGD